MDLIIIITGTMAFLATNIDDLIILTLFFADKNYKNSHIVIGQYIGIISLISISSLAYIFRFIIPQSLIGLLGIIPIIIGIKELIKLKRNKKNTDGELAQNGVFKTSSVCSIAIITFSNGGDNIGIYMPLFANMDLIQILTVTGTFLIMTMLWCFIGYYLVNHSLSGYKIEKYGHIIFPFVLIVLGILILVK